MKKKAQLEMLNGLIIALVTIGIVLAVGFLIMGEVAGQATAIENAGVDVGAANGTAEVVDAIRDIPPWLPIVVVVVIGAFLIGLIGLFRRATR